MSSKPAVSPMKRYGPGSRKRRAALEADIEETAAGEHEKRQRVEVFLTVRPSN